MCGGVNPFGWLYRCTQGSQGFLPQSDFVSTRPEPRTERFSEQPVTYQLSQSVLKGIEQGQYSLQQTQILQAQKLCVNNVIRIQEDKLEEKKLSSQRSSFVSCSDSIIDDKSGDAILEQSLNGTLPPIPSRRDQVDFEPIVPRCLFKCCPNCRPSYRDRAFQSLNGLLTEPIDTLPQWELENRRVSDAGVLTKMDTSPVQQKQQPIPTYRRCDNLNAVAKTQAMDKTKKENAMSKLMEPRRGSGGRTVFRDLVKSAFEGNGQLQLPRQASPSKSDSSSGKCLARDLRKAPSDLRTKESQNKALNPSNKVLDDSQALMLAINMPLPPDSDDSQRLGGVVKVGDGVAVTEEAVEMGSADIIMTA
jgi:hypothetical protein